MERKTVRLQYTGDIDDLIFADEEYSVSSR